jgi:hypothetical protein
VDLVVPSLAVTSIGTVNLTPTVNACPEEEAPVATVVPETLTVVPDATDKGVNTADETEFTTFNV